MALVELEILAVEPYESGRSWGAYGPYEVVRGIAHFAVDPLAEENSTIVDIEHAQRDDAGLVRFDADVRIVRPVTKHTRALLFVVSNRGMVASLPLSADIAMRWGQPTDDIEPGDGFALERGLTVAWCGWQSDVVRARGALGITAPQAVADGAPIRGQMRVEFRSDVPIADHALGDSSLRFSFASYPTADVNDTMATLTVRDWPDGPRRSIDRSRWRFARDNNGQPVPAEDHIWLESGFEPHQYYELVYTTSWCPVVGIGMLAIRDFVSFLRHETSDRNPCRGTIDHTIGMGISQSGRLLREFLHNGLNADESGRPVFDGVLAHIAGSRRGEFNQRYGQASLTYVASFGHLPPFSADPAPGNARAGLLDRQRSIGFVPKIFFTNSSFEYWRSDAALLHIDPDTGLDLPNPPEVREYLFTGVDHIGAADEMKAMMPLANPSNPLDGALLLRAAFANLEAWVRDGTLPPESRIPTISDRTAIPRSETMRALAKAVPGLRQPDALALATSRPLDLGPNAHLGIGRWPAIAGEPLPAWVSAVDNDGNEVAGIRQPSLQHPVATFTGWNPRARIDGLPDVPYEFVGSWLPFRAHSDNIVASTNTEDPRPAISQRYTSREEYETKLRTAALVMVRDRLLLAGDVDRCVAAGLTLYDRATG